MPLGDNFDKWLREQGKEPLTDRMRVMFNDVGHEMYQDWQENREQIVKEVAHGIADLLHQEYKMHEGRWWLFTLGKPARPLSEEEVQYARERGQLP